jgi:hypothetical protein
VGRDEDIQAIVELGRRTRTPTPRWLWVAATVVGVICVTCFIAMMLGSREPPSRPVAQRPAASSGLGTGLVIGAGVGILIGFSIGRQRRSHSSRNSP